MFSSTELAKHFVIHEVIPYSKPLAVKNTGEFGELNTIPQSFFANIPGYMHVIMQFVA